MAEYRLIEGTVTDVDFLGQRLVNGVFVEGSAASGTSYTLNAETGLVALVGLAASLEFNRLIGAGDGEFAVNATNLARYSNQFSNAVWLDQGAAVTEFRAEWTFEDNSAAAYEARYQAITGLDLTRTLGVSWFVKKDAIGRATRFPMFQLVVLGSTSEANRLDFDTSTGAINWAAQPSTVSVEVVNYDSEWWRVEVLLTSADPANDELRFYHYPARGADSGWSISAAATGETIIKDFSVAYDQIEAYFETTGTARSLAETNFQLGLNMICDAGTFTITGFDATLDYNQPLTLNANSGAFAITGFDVSLNYGFYFDAEPGAIVITGIDAGFAFGYSLEAGAAAYAITGYQANLDYSGTPDTVVTVESDQLLTLVVNQSQKITQTIDKTGHLS